MSTDSPTARALWTREVGATLRLAWPLVLSNLAGTGLTTIDLILVGRLGPEALGAAALGTNLYHAVLIASIGLVTAISPMIAASYGARRHAVRDIRRTVRQGIWVAAAAFVPGAVLLHYSGALLLAAGQQPSVAADAQLYLRAMLWALLPNLVFTVLRLFMAALGRPGWGLAVALGALPVNALLASALIFGDAGAPRMGLVGAGIATTITAVLSVVILGLVAVTDRRFRRYHVFGRLWRPDWPRFRTIWRLGLPIAMTLAFEVAFFGATGLVMGILGVVELAAHTIALQIAALCFMVPLGLAQAATVRVGQALGAGDVAGIRRAGWAAFGTTMAFEACTALALLLAPAAMVRAFLDPTVASNAPVHALAVQLLLFAALFQFVDGAQVVGAGMLRGLKDTRVPMIFAGIGYWIVGVPAGIALAFGAGLGAPGLWIGLAIGLASVSVLMLRRWIRRDRLGLLPTET